MALGYLLPQVGKGRMVGVADQVRRQKTRVRQGTTVPGTLFPLAFFPLSGCPRITCEFMNRHPERSEGSGARSDEILRCAQNDKHQSYSWTPA